MHSAKNIGKLHSYFMQTAGNPAVFLLIGSYQMARDLSRYLADTAHPSDPVWRKRE